MQINPPFMVRALRTIFFAIYQPVILAGVGQISAVGNSSQWLLIVRERTDGGTLWLQP